MTGLSYIDILFIIIPQSILFPSVYPWTVRQRIYRFPDTQEQAGMHFQRERELEKGRQSHLRSSDKKKQTRKMSK